MIQRGERKSASSVEVLQRFVCLYSRLCYRLWTTARSVCWCLSVLYIKKRSLPCSGEDKGGRAADKRCVVAAVEIWTTILIVIGWRPTFPVGTIMALACAVCAQTERRAGRVERRQPRADCCGFSIFGSVRDEKWSCRSRNGDSRTWINRAGSVRALLALWFLGNCEHTARCALSYLPGDIFLWRWLTHTPNRRRETVKPCGSDLQLCHISAHDLN